MPFGETGRGAKVWEGEGTRILFGLCETDRPSDVKVEGLHKQLDS